MAVVVLPMDRAAACDAFLTDRPAIYEERVELRGREQITRPLSIPAGTDVIVLARERGLDVTLEVASAGKVIARGDDPIQRTGIQRATFTARDNTGYSLSLVGKEDAGVHGSVEVRVVSPVAKSDSCFETQRALAAANAAYAVGQAVSRGETKSGADADGAYRSAARTYGSVVARLQSSGASALLAQTQHALAVLYATDVDGELARARAWADKALQNYNAVGDTYGNARAQFIDAYARFELALSSKSSSSSDEGIYSARQGIAKARAQLSSVVQFHARRGEKDDQAAALNMIGLTYYEEGLNEEAIRTFLRALTLYEQLGDKLGRAKVLHNTALAETDLGRLTSAAEHYAQVLQLITAKDDPYGYTHVLIANGVASWAGGDVDTALERLGEALELARRIQNVSLQGRALHNIGSVYTTIGDTDLALDFYRQALPLRNPESEAPGRIATLSAIANILRMRGNAAEALKMDREALSLAVGAINAANVRVQIARDLQALGQPNEAVQQLEAVLAAGSGANGMQRAEARYERARARLATGGLVDAESDLRAALAAFKKYGVPALEFDAWVTLAQLQRTQGRANAALSSLDEALALAEEVRTQSANPELRAAVMQPLRPAFDLKIGMLAERFFARAPATGSAPDDVAMEALMTAEQARARALADFENVDVRQVSAERSRERQRLYRELAAHRFQLESRLNDAEADDPRLTSLRSEIITLRQKLDRINAEIGATAALVRTDSATRPRADRLEPAAVPPDTALVEYWLGSEAAFAWVLTRERLSLIRVGTSAEVSADARAFHAALSGLGTTPVSERLKHAERLGDRIIGPIAALIAKKRTVIFAPDGALHYVPFAALRVVVDGQRRFLIEEHDVAIAPSLRSFLEHSARDEAAPPPRQMLLVDDPVYGSSDPRLASNAVPRKAEGTQPVSWFALLRGHSGEVLPRLPSSAREAATIASLLPKGEVDQLEGFNATRDRFLRAPLEEYRFIHVASHAVSDATVPQLSSLILSTVDTQGRTIDGRVMAADLMYRKLRADVVVLSACETALGADVAGEGLIGLRYVVLARGARSVLASLWQVPDQAAMQLMTQFYAALLRDKSPLVAASGNAMRAMLRSRVTDPALWAAFALTVR